MRENKGLKDIKSLIPMDIDRFFVSLAETPYRAKQITEWIYRKGARDFSEMTNLSKKLRERLSNEFVISSPKIVCTKDSEDGTKKFLLRFSDGEEAECVLIANHSRLTLCISTQVGCAMGCKFCLTGRDGFVRNLKAHEMADQFMAAAESLGPDKKITNIVLMGMGEPLLNYREIKAFVQLVTSHNTWAFSSKKITVSTSGIPKYIDKLGRELTVKLAVSLNATTDEARTRLMPINKKYPISVLLDACRRYPLKKGTKITFEYVLINGINDSPDDIKRLVRLLNGIPSKVNLIPFNPFPGCGFKKPSMESILSFQEEIRRHKLTVFIRQSKGFDISAACGLLRVNSEQRGSM